MASLVTNFERINASDLEWASDLPPIAAFKVLEMLLEPIDHARFASVCKGWCSLTKKKYYNSSPERWHKVIPPMLMIPECQNLQKGLLYSVSERTIYRDIQTTSVPCITSKSLCCGTGHGWLAKVEVLDLDRRDLAITLINPFKKLVDPIQLPRLDFIPKRSYNDCQVPKVILSADPDLNPKDYVVLAFFINDFRLAFIKGGQESWNHIVDQRFYADSICSSDAIFYEGQVYAVENGGSIVSFNPSRTNPRVMIHTPTPYKYSFQQYSDRAYLVKSTMGDLLHVRRFLKQKTSMDWEPRMTECFMVYKLVFKAKYRSIEGQVFVLKSIGEQVEIQSIGDETLFVGDNNSRSISASNYSPWCQPNSIYYTDDLIKVESLSSHDYPGGPCDMGIYNLKDRTIAQPYPQSSLDKHVPSAIWINTPVPSNGLNSSTICNLD